MSAVSGLTSKGENKSKQKYQSLNINNLYKGKSLENPKTSVAPKHGLQTLGKVGAGRRMPPPANLPSLKSQISGNPNINLVPTGGQGWGSGKEEDSGATPPLQTSSSGPEVAPMSGQKPSATIPLVTPSSALNVSNVGAIAGGLASAAMAAASKTWNTSTATVSEESGPDKSYLAQQSPFFPQEFPKLDGGNVPQDGTTKAGPETSYGPGPALRPQTEGSWGRGTLPQSNANQPPNAGSGGSGGPTTPPLQPNDPNVQNIQQMSRGLYPQPMTGLPQQRPPIPGAIPVPPNNQTPGPLMPGQTPMNYNQYRMMTQYPQHMAYSRGAYPSGSYPPQGFPQPPHGPINPRQPYFPDSRSGQQMDEDSGGRPRRPAPPIITDKDLKSFDEIMENEVQSGWAAANTEIDYNAKLVFSDDEDSHPPKDSSNYDESHDRNDTKQRDWDRRDYDERREDRPKYRAPQHQHPSQPPQQMPTNARGNNFEYSQHSSQSAQYSRQQMNSSYSHSRQTRSEPIVADEDEMWRQRSRQQSDEMAAAVIRARQRREEEEKEIARSRQAAHEKLKALEEKSLGRDRNDSTSLDFDQCSRHSSDSKEDKLSNRDPRYSNSFQANKVYPKNVPPRFQKQQELMRQTQQTTAPPSHSPPFEQRYNRLPSESDPRDIRNHANNSQPPIKVPTADISRSNSQISSGHESYESERERRTPDDRRQRQYSQSGSESNNWRAVQSQRLSTDKESLSSNARPSDDRDEDKAVQKETKRSVDEIKTDLRESKPKVESFESFSEKRTLIDRHESSHSDKRNTSSKEERYPRKTERLDWAAESESLIVSNSYSQKRDHPRHRPITQKEFESYTEPIKKNFVSLKKNNLSNISPISDEPKDSSLDKTKDDLRKSETPPFNQIGTNVDNLSQSKPKPSDPSKVQTLRDDSHVEQKDKESDRHYDRAADREKESTRDLSKEDKSSRKSSVRYDSYASRGSSRYSGQSYGRGGRGREYRRTRQTSEKSYTESKPSSSPANSRNKSNKSVRRKSNSDESCVSEEIKRESTKSTTDSNSGFKDKPEDDLEKNSDIVMTSSASATVMPNQRNDSMSRRGRGAAAFKYSTRGLPRAYGPSNYGPPPSRAAFGDGGVVKSESERCLDQNRNEKNSETRNLSSRTTKDELNMRTLSSHTSNQFHDNNRNSISNSRKSNAFSGRAPGNSSNFSNNNNNNNNRSEALPPRFQKRHNRGSQSRSDRSRPERSGSSNQIESDLANNEEWETASESSDVADRNDRKTKKNSSTDQRNDSRHHNRKPDTKRSDNPRGQHSNNSGNQSSNYRSGGRNRNQGNVPNSRQTNANQRNGPISSSNHTSDTLTVCAVSDLTLDNPKAVEEVLTDIKNRSKTSADDIEDQINSETEDGFQTVSYKKRNRLNQGNDSKKFKHELSPKLKGTTAVRTSQRKLPPRFAKQKENNRLNTLSNELFTPTTKLVEELKSLAISPKTNESTEKTTKEKIEMTVQTKAVPNAWNKPLSHTQTTASSAPIMTSTKSATTTTNCISHDIQALSVSSKSSSFDQHDSGIDVSDQPPSTASSQRSSPSNDENKLITTTAKVNTTSEVRSDIVSDIDAAKPMCTVIFENTRYKEENKVLAKIAPAKSPSAKDMFVTTTSVTTNVVTETSRTTQAIIAPKKIETVLNEDFSPNDKIQSPNVAKVVGMQRTNVLAPTESELNKKIASVKSVWESPSMTTTIDSKSENSKNVLLNTLITTTEDKKLITNESHTSDSIHTNKVTERTTPKVEYSINSSVETINSLVKSRTPSMTYSTPTPNQMSSHSYVSSHPTQSQQSLISSQQLLLNAISSPPLTESHRSMSGVQQQYQVHNMAATSPAISTPPTMLYNSHVTAHNVYQTFGPQMESLHQTQIPAVMAQFGAQHNAAHYGQHHLLQPQQSQINAANIFMAHQLATQPSAAEQFKYNNAVAQQSLAKSLLSNQFVHQNNSTLQQTLSNAANWTAPNAHSQTNNQTPNYYPQSSSVGTALQAHQQHFAFQSQQSLGLMSAPNQQAAAALVQQSYRTAPLSMARTAQAVDASNPMAANLRSMFAGNIINDMKIGNTVNQTLDNRNPNNRTTFSYNQSTGLQQLQQQQQQMFANQKFQGRAILPIYAQQMLGQTALSGRPNSASMITSNVNSANSYTTPIQRPKMNRNNQSYGKSSHPTHHLSAPQIHQPIHPTHATHAQQVAVSQSALSSAQQAKMRQEAVRQTQSFFAQSSKNESQNESQCCGEVSAESLTQDCVISDMNIQGLNDKMSSINKNE